MSDGQKGLAVRDGWLHTGDLGTTAEQGTIAFGGVIKPMFTRNGFNIYPRELEVAIRELDGVDEARISPDEQPDGEPEIAVAYRGSATIDEVRAWCLTRLSAYKQPSVIVRLPESS